eukprot:TRINITY_DN19512_c0_g1_i1.p1 TRINITY_DN19512_c0_g1~~TRINITY_DN19512_c0_g1_i1.p1  ORF type:complete len:125 (-),score=29.92 TRINITY_DN19512_c0_g1_i1:94-468(-)
MYDLTDRDSFDDVSTRWMEDIEQNAPEDVVVGLVGCKSDLSRKRRVSTEEGAALAVELGERLGQRVWFTETSSKTDARVDQACLRMVRSALRVWVAKPENQDTVKESTGEQSKATSKCAMCAIC